MSGDDTLAPGSTMIGPYEQTAAAKATYDARWERILACVRLEQPKRMPVGFHSFFFPATFGGITYNELMHDYEKAKKVCYDVVMEFEPDGVYPLLMGTNQGRALEKLDFKQLQWPGHGVGDNQPYQYLDREYMKPEEYDDFLFDPTGFYLQKYLPRVASAFEGIEDLPIFPGMHYLRLVNGIRPFSKPTVRKALENLMKAAEEVDRFATHSAAFNKRMNSLGYPLISGFHSVSPYDFVAD